MTSEELDAKRAEHIAKIEALDQLDKQTATAVMGWAIHPRNTSCWMPADDIHGGRVMASTCSYDRWSPTRNDADAARLIQTLWATGRFCSIGTDFRGDYRGSGARARCWLYDNRNGEQFEATENAADDAPAAMRLATVKACLAACASVEETA